MKVLTIVNSLDMGGIEKTFLLCVPHLINKGIKIYVCVFEKDGILEEDFLKLGAYILKIKKTNSILLDFFQVKRLIKEHKIDLIHSRFGFSSGGFVLASLINKIPSIVSIHNTHHGRVPSFLTRIPLFISLNLHKSITYNFATKIIGHSKANLDYNFKNWNSKNLFKVIYNGIDFLKLEGYKSKSYSKFRNQFKNKDVILHIGSFRAQKNHEFMLKVFSKLEPLKNNLFLILVGDGVKKKILLDLIDKLKIRKNVIFTGVQKDIGKYLDVSKIFFFPSTQEGFGNVIIEAQYMNIPVCGSNIPPLDESIYKEYHQYRFDPYNIQEATKSLKKILKDYKSKKLEQSRIRAADFVKRNFSIELMAKQIADLYSDLKDDLIQTNNK